MNSTTTTTADTPPCKGVILVADDLAPNRKMLADTLTALDYQVHTAADGAEALQLCAEIKFDTVMLDVMMPHFTGYEVCAHLRNNASTKHIPVILITALTGRNDRIQGVEVGANDFLVKPVDIQDVILRVRNSVRMKHLHDEANDNYQKLRKTEATRDDLTHMIVHDMRNLINGVGGNLQLLKMASEVPLNEDQLLSVNNARRASDKLLRMINSLLDIGRLEGGRMPMKPETHDFRQIVDDVIGDLGSRTQNVEIEIACPAGANLWCDRNLVCRVMQNLIGNAVDFVPKDGGWIGVNFDTDLNGNARIAVADNGTGVPEELHPVIFEKFATGPDGDYDRHSAGLGLAFCKLALDAHQGHIGISNREEGGSIFWFSLPVPTPVAADITDFAVAA